MALPESARAAVEESRLVHDSVEKVGPLALRFQEPKKGSTDTANNANEASAPIAGSDTPAKATDTSATASTAPTASNTGANTPTSADPANPNITPPRTQAAASENGHTKGDGGGGGEGEGEGEGEANGEGGQPDSNEKSIANTRPPTASDGIWSIEELQAELQSLLGQGCASAYTSASDGAEIPAATLLPSAVGGAEEENTQGGGDKEKEAESIKEWSGSQTFEQRGGFEKPDGIQWYMKGLKGKDEPGYTCYTGLFQLTLGEPPLISCGKPRTTSTAFAPRCGACP